VLTLDLPCDDATATFATYADVVVTALDTSGTDDVVVVGHSLAGHTIPLVADRRPVRRLIYLCALVAMPGHSFAEQLELEPDALLPEYRAGISEPDEAARTRWVDEDVARSVFYADCTAEDARAAFERLRPQAQTPFTQPCPLTGFPPVPRTYVVCSEDRIVNADRGRSVARGRLEADLVELPGSHSPFLSRPADLANVLHHQAQLAD
jgi:pimeloyl-ACP methyl ester carboxylesterase